MIYSNGDLGGATVHLGGPVGQDRLKITRHTNIANIWPPAPRVRESQPPCISPAVIDKPRFNAAFSYFVRRLKQ